MKPRILLVEPQEDIDEISSRLAEVKNDSVALVIPIGAIILQSVISVKILRSKADKLKKQITIVTRDRHGKKFAERLGIPCVHDLEHLEEPPIQRSLNKRKTTSKKIISRPFPNPTNPPQDEEKLREEEKVNKALRYEKKKREILELLSRPNKMLLFSICIISLLLLLVVTTLALPGATIRISPQKKVIESTMNVTLTTGPIENATDSWRQYVLKAIPIESIFDKSIPFQTVSSVFTGKTASGNIIVFNQLNEDLSLRPGTRFQNKDGIVFKTEQWERITPNTEKTIAVTADERDAYGEYSGARGNLEESQKLFLPGLSETARKYVWGEVREPISGGISGYTPVIQEADLQLAEKQITEMILRDARHDSEAYVERKNRLEANDLILLPGDEFLDTEILEIELPQDLIEQNISSFTVRSRMRVKLLAFSRKEMTSILRGALEKTVDPGMELISVEDDGLYPEVLSVSPNKDRVKITVAARGVEAYIIEPKTENGVHFVNRVKEQVLGRKVNDAKKILENFGEVAMVEISLWPPIVGRMPRLPENISVKLLE